VSHRCSAARPEPWRPETHGAAPTRCRGRAPRIDRNDVQRREQLLHARGQACISGRGIAHLIQLRGSRRNHEWCAATPLPSRRWPAHTSGPRSRAPHAGVAEVAPSALQARVQGFACSAFNGLPCPRNSAGRRGLMRCAGAATAAAPPFGRVVPQREAFARAGHVAHRDLHAAGGGPHGNCGCAENAVRPGRAPRAAIPVSAWVVLCAVAAVTSFWIASATACGSRRTAPSRELIPQPLAGGREV